MLCLSLLFVFWQGQTSPLAHLPCASFFPKVEATLKLPWIPPKRELCSPANRTQKAKRVPKKRDCSTNTFGGSYKQTCPGLTALPVKGLPSDGASPGGLAKKNRMGPADSPGCHSVSILTVTPRFCERHRKKKNIIHNLYIYIHV